MDWDVEKRGRQEVISKDKEESREQVDSNVKREEIHCKGKRGSEEEDKWWLVRMSEREKVDRDAE